MDYNAVKWEEYFFVVRYLDILKAYGFYFTFSDQPNYHLV